MSTTISGDTGITFPDDSTQSKAVSQATPFAVTASAIAGAELQLPEATANGVNYVAVKAPNTLAANTTFTLPAADGTNGQFLQTNGSGALAFGNVGVANGGTGATTLTANAVLIGNGTSAVTTVAPDTTGNVLISNGTSWVSSNNLASPLAVVGNATAGAEIRLPEDTDNGSNYVALKAANALAANLTLTLPAADGTNGQVMQTNGSGQLSFATLSTGVTEAGSVARISQTRNLSMFTPAATVITGGARRTTPYFYPSASGYTPGNIFLPQYSTYYGAWYTAIGSALAFSNDGINFTIVDFYGSSLTSVGLSSASGTVSPYVIDDSNGAIFAFGTTTSGYLGYVSKPSLVGAWTGATNLTSASNLWYAEYVSFANAASSGIVFGWSDSSVHYVATIAAGGTTNTTRASTPNNNGQAMSFEWNKTAGVAMSVQRTPSSGQATLFLSPSGNINASWTSVSNTTTGFSPGGSIANTRPIISNAGYGVIWENNSASYRYTTTTTLNGSWTSATSPDSNRIFYIGHNGTVWYMATGATGAPPSSGFFANFYTTTAVTPTSWVSTPQIPLLGLSDSTSFEITPIGYYTQRKY